jgi:hypothetical protein
MPIGFPRPIDPDNFFGISRDRWLSNRMSVPTGALAFFDAKHFRPYARRILNLAARMVGPNVKLVLTKEPGHYMLLSGDDNGPITGIENLFSRFPAPRVFTVEDVVAEVGAARTSLNDIDVLDLLDTIRRDIPTERWDACEKANPWVKGYVV